MGKVIQFEDCKKCKLCSNIGKGTVCVDCIDKSKFEQRRKKIWN